MPSTSPSSKAHAPLPRAPTPPAPRPPAIPPPSPSSKPHAPVPGAPPPPAPARPASVDVLGVPLGLTDYEQTMDWMDAAVASRKPHYVCAVSVHGVVSCQH